MRPWLCALLMLCACRDLSLPPQGAQAPGTVFGRAVYAAPGTAEPQPADGTRVSLVASSLSVTAGTDGRFDLEGLSASGGTLLLQYDSDGDGRFDRQRALALTEVGAGPGRNINLGDVVVGQSAQVHGLVLRSDLKLAGGQAGTQVFVPLTPFVSYAATDGEYALAGLPAGPTDLAFFRAGYLPAAVTGLALQPGEDFPIAEVDLVRDDGTHAGTLSGAVTYQPAAASAAGTTVTATNTATGAAATAQTGDDGAFSFGTLPVGLYDVRAERQGYTAAVVPGVLLFPSQTTSLEVALGQGVESDAGRPAPPDAGPVIVCASTEDCPPGAWCDHDVCAPFCGATVSCSGGRVCDATSHTCVAPCTTTCPSGQVCDAAARVCRVTCDGAALPCPAGFNCVSNACVPQCAVDADCPSRHQTCQGGACVPDGTCDTDLDCPASQLCAGTLCAARRAPDGGLGDAGWPCAGPCECRLGELCQDGVCAPDVVPTIVLDGGGGLAAALGSAKAGDVIALPAGAMSWANDGFTLATGQVTLGGGYVACGSARWIFDPAQTSTLVSDGGTVLRVPGTSSVPLGDVTLRGLTFRASAYAGATAYDAVAVSGAPRLTLSHLQGGFTGTLNGAANHAVFHVSDSDDVDLEQLALLGTSFSGQTVGLWLQHSSGNVSGFSSPSFNDSSPFTAVSVDSQTGPVSLDTLNVTSSASAATGLAASQCGGQPLMLTSSTLGLSQYAGVAISGCSAVDVSDVLIDGSATSGTGFTGLGATNSAGSIRRTHVRLPATATNSDAFSLKGPGGPWTFDENTVDGCGAGGSGHALYLGNAGAVTIQSFSVGGGVDAGLLGGNCNIEALHADTGTNNVTITDSTLVVPGVTVAAIDVANTNLVIERVTAIGGEALQAQGSQVEAYSSFFYALGDGAVLLTQGSLYAVGNTIDGQGSVPSTFGLSCTGTGSSPTVYMSSNLINGGSGATSHLMLKNAGLGSSCFTPSGWDHNYFFYTGPPPRNGNDEVDLVTGSDGGVPDGNGNIVGERTGCYVETPASPSCRLAPGSACVGKGGVEQQRDGSPIPKDLEGHPRQDGGTPDIGAFEL